eukprot:364397-Chlamydomonas_euryale.AAC.30
MGAATCGARRGPEAVPLPCRMAQGRHKNHILTTCQCQHALSHGRQSEIPSHMIMPHRAFSSHRKHVASEQAKNMPCARGAGHRMHGMC